MRHQQLRLVTTLIALTVLFTQAVPAVAQRSSAIDTYAITNARIVTVSGAVIERGTIVIRNGLIHSVGASTATPPADARVIDGTGLTIYPGLLDAYTNLGMPQPSPSPGRGGGNSAQQSLSQAVSSPNSSQPPGLQPELLAVDLLQPGAAQIEAARSAGITTALTAPREGILMGQSALINLAGDTPQQMIVRSAVALHVGFTPLRTGVYPASLMGVFSALRQMLLDAERYREAQAIYEKSPRGLRRPEQDKSLAALLPVLAREMPVVMQANSEREIRRALDLAQEFKLRLIIAGGTESWKVTDRLREQDVPVLLSLNFPRRTTAQVAEADPEPLRTLRERVDAPKTAARLSAARVRFAFQSGAMTEMAGYVQNAAKTVEGGLARDEALRALTLRPAEIFGVADRLGTLEVGKIANLVVTRGDIFDKNARITHVFIDGRPVDLKPAAAATVPTGGGGSTASGTWMLNVNLGEGETVVTLMLQQEGEQLRGSMQGALGSGQISSGSIGQGGDLRFTVPINVGGLTTEATFTGTLNGNEMRGTIQIVGRAPGSYTGTRPAPPTPAARPAAAQPSPTEASAQPSPPAAQMTDISGTWNINFVVGEQTIPATLLLERRGVILTGTLHGTFPTADIIMGTVNADGFRFTSLVQLGGENVELTFEGVVTELEMNSVLGGASTPFRTVMLMYGTVTSTLGSVEFNGSRPKEVNSDR